MQLWNWINEQLFPLFGEVPTQPIQLGDFGSITIEQLLQLMFWVAVGYVAIQVLVLLPYDWCMKLLRRKRWSK